MATWAERPRFDTNMRPGQSGVARELPPDLQVGQQRRLPNQPSLRDFSYPDRTYRTSPEGYPETPEHVEGYNPLADSPHADYGHPAEEDPNETAAPVEMSFDGIEMIGENDDSRGEKWDENATSLMLSQRARTREAADRAMEGIRNRIANEDPQLILTRFERPAYKSIKRTYVNGQQVKEIIPDAPVLSIGLMFLPGADKPTANRLEEQKMTTAEPSQQDPYWRVETAADLLRKFDVDQNLDIVMKDMTGEMQQKAKQRLESSRRMITLPQQGPPSHMKDSPRVTIDSDQVKIVRDLEKCKNKSFDIEATLIEVDEQSMMTLLVGFRRLVAQHGAALSLEDTQGMLSSMVEEVRRLCLRSALLFRASTRTHIIKSKDARYGYNRGSRFLTLTTSTGIREMISLSASFYNTLDSDEKLQVMLRPRFLQMLVVLLSLLNESDLRELKPFIEHTYHIMADRASIEILLLKVLPMASINALTFMESSIPWIAPKLSLDRLQSANTLQMQRSAMSITWDDLLKHLVNEGYFLPGTLSQLGKRENSWSMVWPEAGIKSSSVFKHLQFSGSDGGLLTFNHIPRVEEMAENENMSPDITVLFVNNRKYVIRAPDYDRILCLVPGLYILNCVESGSDPARLHIQEQRVNESARNAVKVTNELINLVNRYLASIKNPSKAMFRIRSSRRTINRLLECRIPGVLSRCVATLDGNMNPLAVAYKRDGNKLQAHSAQSLLMEDTREVYQIINYYVQRSVDTKLDSATHKEVNQFISTIKGHLGACDNAQKSFDRYKSVPDETIADVIQAPGNDFVGQQNWFSYKADYANDVNGFTIEGQWAKVTSAEWLPAARKLVDITLEGKGLDTAAKYTLEPLSFVEDGCEDDEVKPGDQVVLVGKYLVVAGNSEHSSHVEPKYYMENCLKIVSVQQQVRSKRGQNRDSRRGMNRDVQEGFPRRGFL